MKCNTTAAGLETGSLQDVVNSYIKSYRNPAAKEMRFFTNQRTLGDAIQKASLCELSNGKRHNHQRRIPSVSLSEADRRLQRRSRDIWHCRSFAVLHALVEKEIGSIHMIGPLTVYDIAHRIGAKMGLEPEVVYLHRGTAEGAKALLQLRGKKTMSVSDLPKPFHRLKPHEAEDCLCIYKEKIKSIAQQWAAV
jgi:hypothetical protein